MNTDDRNENKVGGIKTKTILIPLSIILVLLHFIVIVMILLINKHSTILSMTNRRHGSYTSEATELLAGSSLLSETASTFVLKPKTQSGEMNVSPLVGYANELGRTERRGDVVVAHFEGYDVPAEAVEKLRTAAASANEMMKMQQHAIELVRAVYPLPPIPALDAIPRYELTEEEKALSDEDKLSLAVELVFGEEYTEYKRSVSDNVPACISLLVEEQTVISVRESRALAITRVTMWVVTISVIVILFFTFTAFMKLVFSPIGKFVKNISVDESLDKKKGLYEVRLLASAYNKLLKRRETLEDALRDAAETDALTKLPNRYCFNRALSKVNECGYSVAIFMFDINYLKDTNDRLGHIAGDELICRASDCIRECFGEKSSSNCYRFGGDEFAAIVKDITPDEIEAAIAKFEKMQAKNNVSIALGYEYTDDVGKTPLSVLFAEADKKMYENKIKMHEQDKKAE